MVSRRAPGLARASSPVGRPALVGTPWTNPVPAPRPIGGIGPGRRRRRSGSQREEFGHARRRHDHRDLDAHTHGQVVAEPRVPRRQRDGSRAPRRRDPEGAVGRRTAGRAAPRVVAAGIGGERRCPRVERDRRHAGDGRERQQGSCVARHGRRSRRGHADEGRPAAPRRCRPRPTAGSTTAASSWGPCSQGRRRQRSAMPSASSRGRRCARPARLCLAQPWLDPGHRLIDWKRGTEPPRI